MLLNCRGKLLSLTHPVVMGILNITEDSFYDGRRYNTLEAAIKHTSDMLEQGAKIIDIGAVSTRPGAKAISAEDEWQKLSAFITPLRKTFPLALFSVDTYRAEVARRALEEGADMINDISAGDFDSSMFDVIAKYRVPYIIMHIQGTPQTMQQNPQYKDVVKDILFFFSEKIEKLNNLGINDVIIDPGIGFGKTIKHNYEIIRNLEFFTHTAHPVLLGVSRKSLIYKLLNISPQEALNGTTALHTVALQKGVKILRVHDVKEAMEVIKMSEYL
ncbi:MAG: Dihydropteroate synthase [Bacteroidetes bacterium ADurb.Bin408]|nr:MAG: Dihydropteroate synthase [Bacteroidetes bacterium ADurb.Bin408]